MAKAGAVSLRRRGHKVPRSIWHLPPDGFRELRRSCLLSRKACAELLGCSLSCVRAWDRGTHRVPRSAVKLLRLLRSGDLGALRAEWHGWTLNRNGLVSPSGIAYSRGDLGWWSLTCRQAEAFRLDCQRQRARGTRVPRPAEACSRGPGFNPAASACRSVPTAELLPADRSCCPRPSSRGDVGVQAPKPGRASAASRPARGLSAFRNKGNVKGKNPVGMRLAQGVRREREPCL